MTISEIIARVRREANDDGASPIKEDPYYIELIIQAIFSLEGHMGALVGREDVYQFQPLRDNSENVLFQDDGIIPEIDSDLFYNPDTVDSNSPSDILVNNTLKVATGKAFGTIETAEFINGKTGMPISEEGIAFIKIDASAAFTSPDTLAFDVSLDDRESWLNADYGVALNFNKTTGTTGYVDVSRYPSSKVVLKWKLTGPTVLVRDTIFSRLYIPSDKLRHYALDIIEMVKLQFLEINLDRAIKKQNDPLVINGIQQQIANIRRKYGIDKAAGDTQPMGGGRGVTYCPGTREEAAVFGTGQSELATLLRNGRIVGVTSNGQIRRT